MKAKAIKYYELPIKFRRQIADEVGCTLMTVRRALELDNPTQGDMPDAIRQKALAMGARVNVKYKYIEQ